MSNTVKPGAMVDVDAIVKLAVQVTKVPTIHTSCPPLINVESFHCSPVKWKGNWSIDYPPNFWKDYAKPRDAFGVRCISLRVNIISNGSYDNRPELGMPTMGFSGHSVNAPPSRIEIVQSDPSLWNGVCARCGRGTYTGLSNVEHEGGVCK